MSDRLTKPVDPPPPKKAAPPRPLVRAHTYGCMCELCRWIPIREHPDAFE